MSTILTPEEDQKRLKLIHLLKEACDIVEKYKHKFQDDPEYKLTIEDLEMGLSNLTGRIDLLSNTPEWIKLNLNRPKEKRGGFGLSRGFGEFLLALPKEDEYWADEILDAVYAIENYYREM